MVSYHYTYEGPLVISTTNLIEVPTHLAEISLMMIARQLKQLLGAGAERVRCASCGSWGAETPAITASNLFLPSVLVCGFLVMARGSQSVQCKLEEKIVMGSQNFDLTAAVVSQPMHFLAISKLQGLFYNLDNLDTAEGKIGYPSLKEALLNKNMFDKEEVCLDKRSRDCRRAGAVMYSIYVGNKTVVGQEYEQFCAKAVDINKLLENPGGQVEDARAQIPPVLVSDLYISSTNLEADYTPIEDNLKSRDSEVKEQFEKEKMLNPASGNECDDESEACTDEEDLQIEDLGTLDADQARMDLRLRTFQDMGRLCRLYPGAYFDHDKGAWFCRKCQSFAFPSSATNAWISTSVTLGDHPTRKMKKHFESDLHKKCIESEKLFRKPSVYSILNSQAVVSKSKKEILNRNALKSFFTIALHMVKNCLPNDGFQDMVKMVADAGASELKQYLQDCPKNATHLRRQSFEEMLTVMNDYIETPVLEALKSEFFTIFTDETTAVGNKSMANVYVMFNDGNGIQEHYLGLVNMNPGLGLTARHFYNAIEELCRGKGISLQNCVFSEMDGCSTNQGRIKGLKLYFSFHNPHHISESCGSHKLAIGTKKHVVEGKFPTLREADQLAVALASFFHGSSLRTAIFENTQQVLEGRVLKLISPSATRWLTHGNAFERLLVVLPSTLVALNSIYTDKEDFEALGLLLGMIRPTFLLSCLALHDVFKVMSQLTHWLQTSPSHADITMVPVMVQNTVKKLLFLAGDETQGNSIVGDELKNLKFNITNFKEMSSKIDQFVLSCPVASNTRMRRNAADSLDKEAVFEDFKEEVFEPFAQEMADSIEGSMHIDPVCKAFACLDYRNFPASLDEFDTFGENDLDVLINWYGVTRRGIFPGEEGGNSFSCDPIVDPAKTKLEYKVFKEFLKTEGKKLKKESMKNIEDLERNVTRITHSRHSGRDKRKLVTMEKEIKRLQQKQLTLGDIFSEFEKQELGLVMPNIMKLLLLSILSPIGNAVVERLFSLMKITKTVLRNRLGEKNLDFLLRLNKEAPETWTDEQKEDLVNLWVEKKKTQGREFRWQL